MKAAASADAVGAVLPKYGRAGSKAQWAGPGDRQTTNGTLATCTVTTRADSGAGSLRACLSQAAANGTILFDPAVFPPASPASIELASTLPTITVNGLTVDGSDAGVVLDGSGLSAGSGLVVAGAGGVTIRGLQILNFPVDGIELLAGAHDCVIGGDRGAGAGPTGQGNLVSGNGDTGIWLEGPGTRNNHIQGNFIGTDLGGSHVLPNSFDGVLLVAAEDNVVGGETPCTGNLISGNGRIGVNINEECTGNRVVGNTIGANVTGVETVGNAIAGVLIGFGAQDNVVGGATAAARNLISGNGVDGVLVKDTGTTGNVVSGNFIGTDASGTGALGNAEAGVLVAFGAQDNTIGGTAAGAGNLISGNGNSGVWMQNDGTTGNRVMGNCIGVDLTGANALRNGNDGITIISGAGGNTIGGDAPGAGNIVSGNADTGITIHGLGSDGNRMLGNIIGPDVTGTKAIGSSGDGIVIMAGASNNVVGGDTPGARNLISGNDDGNPATEQTGIFIQDAGTQGNRILGNYIGTDAAGAAALGNGGEGIVLALGAHGTVIGGETPGAANVISGNDGHGVKLQQAGTDGNRIVGNIIGLDAGGAQSLTNHDTGVFIGFGASNNLVGGSVGGERNLINGGVWLQEPGTTGNRVEGNYIGTDASGTAAPGNHGHGVVLLDGPSGNVVGGEAPGAGNLISGNARHGVSIEGAGATGNAIMGNIIGADVAGEHLLGNGLNGVVILDGASENAVGGNTAAARNLISGNGRYGVQLQDPGTAGNRVQGNFVGTDASGTAVLPNAKDGVIVSHGASDNLVGGVLPGQGNLISGNGEIGVNINIDTTGNRVLGNTIGADVTGAAALGNAGSGVLIGFGAYDNVVGGPEPGEGNLISGNSSAGILIKNLGTTGNRVLGNTIGMDASRALAIANALDGVAIAFAASGNFIGGEAPGEGNLIGGNSRAGIRMQDSGTTGNRVAGNTIGAGAGLPGNQGGGVVFTAESQGNTLGPDNSIVFNGAAGVIVSGATTLRNTITRNLIHHNAGLPIDFVDTPQPIGPVGAPVLGQYMVGNGTLTGKACAGCRVEVYANPDAQPAGTVYLATATANATGDFSLALGSVLPLPFLHGTVTDGQGTTSEFSSGLMAGARRVYLPVTLR